MSRKEIKVTRRLQLIEANIACIAKLGLTDTTIADVAKTADMSRGIVNFYFESKEKMMRETLGYLAEDYQRALEASVQDSSDRLKSIIDVHFAGKLCSAKRLAVWMAFVAHAASHASYRALLLAAQNQAQALFTACGAVRPEELWALIQGMWMQMILTPDASARPAMAAQCLDFARGAALVSAKAVRPIKRPAEVLPMFDLFAENA